jgi:exopolysaccharide production protein ExoZ
MTGSHGGRQPHDWMRKSSRVETVIPIQILRGLAAMAVVAAHAAENLDRFSIAPGAFQHFALGAAGVDLFFVISGFVMVYASEPLFGSSSGALTFFCHRLIRIVPLYWLVTALYVSVATFAPRFATAYPVTTIATSLLFIPIPRSDGIVQPVIGQGWTLNYEMFFYAIFAVAVILPRRPAVILASVTLGIAVQFGCLFAPLPSTVSFWTDPIVLEFVAGMFLGLIYRQGAKLSPLLGAGMIVSGIILFVLGDFIGLTQRLLAWGAPAALVVAGATFGRFSLRGPVWHAFVVLGNASYALYLVHMFPLRALVPLASWLHLHVAHWIWLYALAAITAPVLAAVLVHYAFERPVTKALRRYVTFAQPRKHRTTIEGSPLPAEWKS